MRMRSRRRTSPPATGSARLRRHRQVRSSAPHRHRRSIEMTSPRLPVIARPQIQRVRSARVIRPRHTNRAHRRRGVNRPARKIPARFRPRPAVLHVAICDPPIRRLPGPATEYPRFVPVTVQSETTTRNSLRTIRAGLQIRRVSPAQSCESRIVGTTSSTIAVFDLDPCSALKSRDHLPFVGDVPFANVFAGASQLSVPVANVYIRKPISVRPRRAPRYARPVRVVHANRSARPHRLQQRIRSD